MKTKIVTAATLALLAAASVQNATAGDREWSTAGKVLTGVAAASIIARAFEPRPVYYVPPPTTVVYQQPVAYTTYTTAPAVVTSQPVATIPNAPVVQYAPAVPQQQVVVQSAPTVVYTQPAVVYAPSPVVYAPAPYPYYYGPRVGFSVVVGGGGYRHYRRW